MWPIEQCKGESLRVRIDWEASYTNYVYSRSLSYYHSVTRFRFTPASPLLQPFSRRWPDTRLRPRRPPSSLSIRDYAHRATIPLGMPKRPSRPRTSPLRLVWASTHRRRNRHNSVPPRPTSGSSPTQHHPATKMPWLKTSGLLTATAEITARRMSCRERHPRLPPLLVVVGHDKIRIGCFRILSLGERVGLASASSSMYFLSDGYVGVGLGEEK